MSGIYIPGMDMPIACTFCPCAHDNKCDITRKKQTFLEWHESRPGWCPLIPVPDHGRLIDADALRQTMYHEAFETDSTMQKWDSGCWIRYKMFERMEEAALTIIPADSSVMYYPQVNGITPTVITEEGET